jgi:hypothetical protein
MIMSEEKKKSIFDNIKTKLNGNNDEPLVKNTEIPDVLLFSTSYYK